MAAGGGGFRPVFVFRAISFNCLEADFKFFIADASSLSSAMCALILRGNLDSL